MACCKNNYSLPVNSKFIKHWCKRWSLAHKGKLKHSLDLWVSEGTPVFAALDGGVVWLKRGSKVGGISRKYYYLGNRIVLKHKNGEYTAYEHLKYGGVLVKVGQKVRKGKVIGLSGSTGFAHAPHIHFEVFRNPDKEESEGETLQVCFGLKRIGTCGKFHKKYGRKK